LHRAWWLHCMHHCIASIIPLHVSW
jgi:hypothetical protein